jgi:hypothetical protein
MAGYPMTRNKLSILLIALLAGSVATPAQAASGRRTTLCTRVMAYPKAKWKGLTASPEEKVRVAFRTTQLPAALLPIIAAYLPEKETIIDHLLNKDSTEWPDKRREGYPFLASQFPIGIGRLAFDPSDRTINVDLWYSNSDTNIPLPDVINEAVFRISPNRLAQMVGDRHHLNVNSETIKTYWNLITDKVYYIHKKINEPFGNNTFADVAIKDNNTEVSVHVYQHPQTHTAIRAAFLAAAGT